MHEPQKNLNESGGKLVPDYTVTQAMVRLGADRPLRIESLNVSSDVRVHDHEYYEICFVNRGTGVHQTQQYRALVRQGTVMVVPPGESHGLARIRRLKVTNIYYLSEWLLSDLRQLWDQDRLVPLFLARSLFRLPMKGRIPQFQLTPQELSRCVREIVELGAESARAKPSMVYLRAGFTKLLIVLSRAFVRSNPEEIAPELRGDIWQMLHLIEEAVMESRPFSVARLAEHWHRSTDHLSRMFREATGWSLMAFYQQRRVQQAGCLLLNPQKSVTEVAYELGYADAAHLSRMFRNYRGISPRQFRKMYLR